jgi:hypothetical protein
MATTPCAHKPPCPTAADPDREAAHTVAHHAEQGWALLCNGVLLFEDTGELLPDGQIIAPHRPLDGVAATGDDLFVRYMAAFEAATEHMNTCPACQADAPCTDGDLFADRLEDLQDQHTARQKAGLAPA